MLGGPLGGPGQQFVSAVYYHAYQMLSAKKTCSMHITFFDEIVFYFSILRYWFPENNNAQDVMNVY
jgi:hypothetical protein